MFPRLETIGTPCGDKEQLEFLRNRQICISFICRSSSTSSTLIIQKGVKFPSFVLATKYILISLLSSQQQLDFQLLSNDHEKKGMIFSGYYEIFVNSFPTNNRSLITLQYPKHFVEYDDGGNHGIGFTQFSIMSNVVLLKRIYKRAFNLK